MHKRMILALAFLALPAVAMAQGGSPAAGTGKPASPTDSSTDAATPPRTQEQVRHDSVVTTSRGDVATPRYTKSWSLTRDQVLRLQTALNNNGCSVGTPDGVMNTKTHAAIKCAMQKNNIPNDDRDALLKSLNLDFSTGASGQGGTTSTPPLE